MEPREREYHRKWKAEKRKDPEWRKKDNEYRRVYDAERKKIDPDYKKRLQDSSCMAQRKRRAKQTAEQKAELKVKRAATRRVYRANMTIEQRAKLAASQHEFYKKHYKKSPEKYKAKGRAYWLKSNYGISEEDYKRMIKQQGGACKICLRVKPLHVDHCHHTGKVRGLLCKKCNTGIGMLHDNVSLLLNAVAYLR